MPSIPRQLLILFPYVVSVAAMMALASVGIRILSAERAYMAMHNVWSQQQKIAVANLYRYAASAEPVYYRAFDAALAMPEAEARARAALDSEVSDQQVLRQNLLAGGSDPQDIGSMIQLDRYFGRVEFMQRIRVLWRESATSIAELRQVGEAIHAKARENALSDDERRQAVIRIGSMERVMGRVEHDFSQVLDQGYRDSLRWLSSAFAILTLLLTSAAILFSLRQWRRMARIASELMTSQEHLRLVVSGSNDGVWDWNLLDDSIYYSPRFKQLLSIPEGEPGYDRKMFAASVHPNDLPLVRGTFRRHVHNGDPYDVDFRLRTRRGDYRWFHSRGKSVRNAGGKLIRMAGSVTEIGERKTLESELAFLASHDPLTGVLNRRRFKEILHHALQSEDGTSKKPILLFLDLDQFKIVNDTCGHAAGDQLLRDVTDLFGQWLGDDGVIARLGGDEFAVLLTGHSVESAWAVAETLRVAVHDFQFVHKDRAFWLGVSIGLVVLEPGLDTVDAVLTHADRACYLAKDEGRNRICLYAHSDREIVVRRDEMDWMSRMRQAISENRLQLFAQPIVPVGKDSSTEDHVEVLLRLVDEYGVVVPPMAFIPAAERFGLMPEIDRWVIQTAFNLYAVKAACAPAGRDQVWAVNLSGATLGDDDFPSFLQRQFMEHGVPYGAICFEITETAAVSNLRRAGKFMKVMKLLGCRFALDDFGAGASSFSYLKQLPVDYLKIDASLVRDLLNDPVDDVMVEAIHRIGHVMNIETIAEGVEDKRLLERLAEIGVDFAQGYALGMPEPLHPLAEQQSGRDHAMASGANGGG
jgi:diguanylate cyclase (GGDEF)-like protein/PAS domain S-box-containing protein